MTLNATAGDKDANSYATVEEAQAYFDTRLTLDGWENADDQAKLLIMATRVIDAYAAGGKVLVVQSDKTFYRTRRRWAGAPATTTQALAWPRTGMVNLNGNAIPDNEIPQALKNATAEMAGQLGISDRTLDNDVVVQGLTSIRAGSVSLTFKDYIEQHVLPDAVWLLMPDSWFTDETLEITGLLAADFDVVNLP